MRRQARFHLTPLDRYQVRIARTVREYEDAFRLVHAAYVFQGIENVQAPELRCTPQQLSSDATVLVAYEGDVLVGTMTVTADSAAGLPLDKDCLNELTALRQQGARLVEYGAYAIVERCWSAGVSDLLYIAANVVTSSTLSATHVVIGVNPRATPFYRAIFNFRELAKTKQHATLRAPVVGLVQDLSRLEAFLRHHYTRPMASGRVPAEHFFGAPLACINLHRRGAQTLRLVTRDDKEQLAC